MTILPTIPVPGRSPLSTLKAAFDALAEQPCPLEVVVQFTDRTEAVSRRVPLGDLLDALLSGSVTRTARRKVWTTMIGKARAGRPEWTVAVCGLAYPVLAAAAGFLRREFRRVDEEDLQADLLTEYLHLVRGANLRALEQDVLDVAGHLAWRAHAAVCKARTMQAMEERHASVEEWELDPAAESERGGQYLLHRAVAAGVVTEGEAELIAANRVDGLSVREAGAKAFGSRSTGYRVRAEAEARLAAWILGAPKTVRAA